MKKLISILFTFTVLLVSLFADKSRFYEKGKLIEIMYVDSEEGLRIRNEAGLSGKRITLLSNMTQVKVLAIGKEETIDGNTAPWVEIQIPWPAISELERFDSEKPGKQSQ